MQTGVNCGVLHGGGLRARLHCHLTPSPGIVAIPSYILTIICFCLKNNLKTENHLSQRTSTKQTLFAMQKII